jgi:cytochrome c-type biogenesis protein CcmF
MFAVLWGTLFPLLSEGFLGQKISVGPPFFDRVTIPLGLILLALMGIGPVIAWRKATRATCAATSPGRWRRGSSRRRCWPPRGAPRLRAPHLRAGAFTMTTIVVEFHKGTRARARIEGEATRARSCTWCGATGAATAATSCTPGWW